MIVNKKVISNLVKCYSIAPLIYNQKEHFLVASEINNSCLLFDQDGREEEVIWHEPGGTMTMVQVPGTNGQFLATHRFYSPDNCKEAKIVIVTPAEDGQWKISTLSELPGVHRFDILERNGRHYLLACTVKSDYEYDDDWRFPGKIYTALLPDKLDEFNDDHQLKLTVLKDNMLKNHGYYKIREKDTDTGLISCGSGVYQIFPPESPKGEWEIHQLIREAASDAVLVDLDTDGEKELAVIAPFHGAKIRIYKKAEAGNFEKTYEFEESRDFLHSIYGGMICGQPVFITGHRKEERDLMMFRYDKEHDTYRMEYIDRSCGSANVYHYVKDGKDVLISANREIDEIALYMISEE